MNTSNSLKLAAMLALAALAGPAMAQQTANPAFTGWGVGVSIASSQNKREINYQVSSGEFKTTTVPVSIVASYGFAMGPQWVGTVGLSYDLGNTDFGTVTDLGATVNTVTGRNRFSASFAPGIRVGGNGLAYAKLAWHQITITSDYSQRYSSVSDTLSGVGLGVGYAHALSRPLELRAEYESIRYNDLYSGKVKHSQDRLSLGLLYKF